MQYIQGLLARKIILLTPIMFIVLLGVVLRLHHFDRIIFDSDFGRDALFGWRISQGNLTLLGPAASVGGFYLGPLYFYMIAVLFFLSGANPQIISLFFILLAACTIVVLFKILKQLVGTPTALLAGILVAVHPELVQASRSATHMPMIPLVTVLVLFSLFKFVKLKSDRAVWSSLLGLAYGLFMHVHFSALLLLPGLVSSLIILSRKTGKTIQYLGFFILGCLVMGLPLIIFDLRHDFITSKAFFGYITQTIRGDEISGALQHMSFNLKLQTMLRFFSHNYLLGFISAGVVLAGTLRAIVAKKKTTTHQLTLITAVLFFSMVLELLIYRGYLYGYYFLVPLMVGVVLFALSCTLFRGWFRYAFIAVVVLVQLRHITYPETFRTPKNQQRITEAIQRDLNATRPESFTVFKDSADGLTGLAYEYRFFLETSGSVPLEVQRFHEADVMYLIREQGEADPLTLGNWEVQQFEPAMSETLEQFTFRFGGKEQTVDLFRLTSIRGGQYNEEK